MTRPQVLLIVRFLSGALDGTRISPPHAETFVGLYLIFPTDPFLNL